MGGTTTAQGHLVVAVVFLVLAILSVAATVIAVATDQNTATWMGVSALALCMFCAGRRLGLYDAARNDAGSDYFG